MKYKIGSRITFRVGEYDSSMQLIKQTTVVKTGKIIDTMKMPIGFIVKVHHDKLPYTVDIDQIVKETDDE